MEEDFKIDDIVLVRGGYACIIVGIKKGWFGKVYVCTWIVNDHVYKTTYKTSGTKRKWQILCKLTN